MNSFQMLPQALIKGRCFFSQPHRPCEYYEPVSTSFKVAVIGNGHTATAFLHAQVWFPWQSEPGGKPVPGLWTGVECAQSNTQGLCLIPSSLLPFIFAAATAAKSLQSCLTLCDPIDGSPPGSAVPGILQAKNTGVGCHFLLQCMQLKRESEVVQSCPTLCDPMDCSLPGSSIHGISQTRVLEWGAYPLSLGYPNSCNTVQGHRLPSVGGVTLRKEAGGGNPTTRNQRAPGTFQSSSSPKAPPWGAVSLLSLQACPSGSGGNGPMQRAAGTPGPRAWGDTLAGTLPSPTTLQPWDPSLLRPQGCDTSPGHQGLRRAE